MSNRALVTTIVRYTDLELDSGFTYVIDLDTKAILSQSPMPESMYRAQEHNPRGGLRGVRGAAVWQNRLVIANTEQLLFFDQNWNIYQEFTHPWLGGIHDMTADKEGVWVCCTNADLLVKVSWQGDIIADWEWRQDTMLRKALRLPPILPVDRSLDYRNPETMRTGLRNTVHLNSVSADPDGRLLLSFGRILPPTRIIQTQITGWLVNMAHRLGISPPQFNLKKRRGLPVGEIPGSSYAIIRLNQDGQSELIAYLNNIKVPNHNILHIGGRLLYNDSNDGRLIALSIDGRPPQYRTVDIPGSPPFARGLASLSENLFLVGSQNPTAVHCVDLQTQTVTGTIHLSDRSAESVYAISLLPNSFTTPPATYTEPSL